MPEPIVAENWYQLDRISADLNLIWEPHIAQWLRCNMWHVRGRDYDLLIDTGMGLRPLKASIAQLMEKPIKAVLSHSHFDHVGGTHEFAERLGHPAEAHLHADPHAEDDNNSDDGESAYQGYVRAETFSALPFAGFEYRSYDVRPAPLTGYLDEGDVIDLGDRYFQVFHLPGHSPGSIVLFESKTGTLFAGDVIYNGDLFEGSDADPEFYRESLARLRELPVEIIHGGHFPSFGRQRMLEIIDLYLSGKGRITDTEAWIQSQL